MRVIWKTNCARICPFQLTSAQERVLNEIKQDMAASQKMTRLLQGDVGSGKTIVALLALLNAVEAGFQGVLMAPTDILARQHLNTLKRYCDPLNVRVEILTGREKGTVRKKLLSDLKENKINILIGLMRFLLKMWHMLVWDWL